MDDFTLNNDQLRAVSLAAQLNFAIITGGAGVGKTTVIKSIVEACGGATLCCPTGKAAARLREASGLPAMTVHSLLGFNGSGFCAGNLHGQHIIIDEASMLDSSLLYNIIIRQPNKITLVGDDAQLSPVGKGQPFHDLVRLRGDITARLSICYRNQEAIFSAASAIRGGEMPTAARSESEIFVLRSTGDVNDTGAHILKMIRNGELDFEQDIVLSCRNETVDKLNTMILQAVNPHDDGEKWRIGDRIICTKNFSGLDVWNGTTGTITAIDEEGKIYVHGDLPFWDATFNDYVPEISWSKGIMDKTRHAYALTVHKAQGSQYRKIIFVLASGDMSAVNRALVYTAVTRARIECHIIGEINILQRAIAKLAEKKTVLQQFAAGKKPLEV